MDKAKAFRKDLMVAISKGLTSPAGKCAILALFMLLLRIICFDYVFFLLESIPNHDMYEGAPFFATSMHSIRLTGEIAWWNPTSQSHNGYAQYFQHFVGPLAPTPHHIIFILWAQAILLLSKVGLVIPEYFQYLVINYIILPYLTFFAFALFCSLIFSSWLVISFCLIVFTLSGIGVWHSTWYYFQEPFTLFLLLAGVIGVLQKPTLRRMGLAVIALSIQLISCNYWTANNLWFILIILGTYGWAYPYQVKRLWQKLKQLPLLFQQLAIGQKIFIGSVLGVLGLSVLLWLVITGSVAAEQSSQYIRSSLANHEDYQYSIDEAHKKATIFTYALANWFFSPAIVIYERNKLSTMDTVHALVYVGAALIPFLLLLPVSHWYRRTRWLTAATVAVIGVCLAPPFLLHIWSQFPFNRVGHLFYFYQHFLRILLVLLAGLSAETYLKQRQDAVIKQRFYWVIGGLVVISAVGIVFASSQITFNNPYSTTPYSTTDFTTNVVNSRAARVFLITLVMAAGLLQSLNSKRFHRRRSIIILAITLCLFDLSNFFWLASKEDQAFTASGQRGWNVTLPLEKTVQSALKEPWNLPEPTNEFYQNLFSEMPVKNNFWPDNNFLVHRRKVRYEIRKSPAPPKALLQSAMGASLEWFDEGSVSSDPGFKRMLILSHQGQEPAMSYTWKKWGYNSHSIEVDTPADGWMLIRQNHDRLWKIRIDNTPVKVSHANLYCMAVQVKQGTHQVQIDYQPLGRMLYWPTSLLFEAGVLGVFLLMYFPVVSQLNERIQE